jgi:vancomycin resistance protein YoaR
VAGASLVETPRGWLGRAVDAVRHAVLPEARPASMQDALPESPVGDDGIAGWPRRVARLGSRLALIAALALLVTAVALFAFRAVYADKVYPAVAVGDVPVGGMTVEQAVATVEARAAELERGTVAFTHEGRTWTPTLAELGATVDIEASVDAAWALGRDDNAVGRLGFASELLQGDQQVPLRTTVDRETLDRWFETVNTDLGQRAVNASLVVDGAEVIISPERAGTVVDEVAATELILAALVDLEPVTATLPTMTETPEIHADDLDAPRRELAAALGAPVVAVFEGQQWEIPPADLTAFLTVETRAGSGGPDVELSVDRTALASYLRDAFSGRVNRAPVDARIAWSAEQGGLVALDPSVNGAALRSNAFADAVAESFLTDRSSVEVPVVVTRPEVDSTNLAALGIDGLLARGDSNFDGGAEARDTNISVGTELLNGELIAPGEEFSFNSAVGEITYDKGFMDGGVIENGIIGRAVGGGICQVSTTVFRAALLGGLPITEWWPHSLRLTGYERDGWTAGYDASILQSGSNPEYWADFRFRNDTDGYMLVQAWNDYPYNIVEIYGADDGREVAVGDAQFANPADAYIAWFTRVVTYPGGITNERTFESYYS